LNRSHRNLYDIEELSLCYSAIKCIQSSLIYSAHHNKTLRLLFIKLSLSKWKFLHSFVSACDGQWARNCWPSIKLSNWQKWKKEWRSRA